MDNPLSAQASADFIMRQPPNLDSAAEDFSFAALLDRFFKTSSLGKDMIAVVTDGEITAQDIVCRPPLLLKHH
jgi:hypothetical protein